MAASKPTSLLSKVEDAFPHLAWSPRLTPASERQTFRDLNLRLGCFPFGYRAYPGTPTPAFYGDSRLRTDRRNRNSGGQTFSEFDRITGD